MAAYKDTILADFPLAYYRLGEALTSSPAVDEAGGRTYSQIAMNAANVSGYNSTQNGSYPWSRLFDGDLNSNNYTDLGDSGTSNTGTPTGFVYDFGSSQTIGRVYFLPYNVDSRTYYKPKIEVSTDGTTWTTVWTAASAIARPSIGTTASFTPVACRYLRYSSVGSTSNSGNHLVEFRSFSPVGSVTLRPGSYAGAPILGQPGALARDSNTAMKMNSAGYVAVPSFPIPLDDISFEFWLNATINQNNYIFGWQAADVANRCSSHMPWGDGNIYWDYGNLNSGGRIVLSYAPYLNNGWHHIVLTGSRTGSPGMAIYIDAVLRNSSTPGANGVNNVANSPLGIGASGIGELIHSGTMDEFAVYNYVLSPSQIANHYDAGLNQPFVGNFNVAGMGAPKISRGVVPAIPSADAPLSYPTKQISGHVYNTGSDTPQPVEGATVLLVRQSDGITVAQQFSGPGGVYLFVRNGEDVSQYFVVAFSIAGGTTQVHGTSNRGLVAT